MDEGRASVQPIFRAGCPTAPAERQGSAATRLLGHPATRRRDCSRHCAVFRGGIVTRAMRQMQGGGECVLSATAPRRADATPISTSPGVVNQWCRHAHISSCVADDSALQRQWDVCPLTVVWVVCLFGWAVELCTSLLFGQLAQVALARGPVYGVPSAPLPSVLCPLLASRASLLGHDDTAIATMTSLFV